MGLKICQSGFLQVSPVAETKLVGGNMGRRPGLLHGGLLVVEFFLQRGPLFFTFSNILKDFKDRVFQAGFLSSKLLLLCLNCNVCKF